MSHERSSWDWVLDYQCICALADTSTCLLVSGLSLCTALNTAAHLSCEELLVLLADWQDVARMLVPEKQPGAPMIRLTNHEHAAAHPYFDLTLPCLQTLIYL